MMDIHAELIKAATQRALEAERKQLMAMYAFLSGEGGWLFGKRILFTMSWPEGLPRQFRTSEEVQEWAKRELAKLQKVGSEFSASDNGASQPSEAEPV